VTCIIHRSQGLIFDHLTFDSTSMTKHDLTYTALSRVHSRKNLYLFFPLLNKFFQVDHIIRKEMFQLKTNA
jgi:ATP-dependent exoDNAse (exonuclease V) alpha subunit